MQEPSVEQLVAAFVAAFREESGRGDQSAVPVGDAEVFLEGVVDLPELLAPLLAAAWDSGHRAATDGRDLPGGPAPGNPFGLPAALPTLEEALALLEPEEGPDDGHPAGRDPGSQG